MIDDYVYRVLPRPPLRAHVVCTDRHGRARCAGGRGAVAAPGASAAMCMRKRSLALVRHG